MAESVEIKGCRIVYKNFSGRADKFNDEGRRNFAVVLSPEQAQDLSDQGYNVKERPPRDPEDDPFFYLKVNVKFDTKGRPPRVVMVTQRNQTRLDEDLVDMLDDVYIEKANIRFRGWEYDPGKHSAYLQTLFAQVVEDELGMEFDHIPMAGATADQDEEEDEGAQSVSFS